MKFSQLLLLIILIGICNTILTFSIGSRDISTLETDFSDWFEDDNTFIDTMDDFSRTAYNSDNWLVSKFSEIAQGFTEAVNLVTVGLKILGLVIWGQIKPYSVLISQSMSDNLPILRAIGYVASLFLQWFNLMLIVRLYKLWKGSDQ